jgi:hypothetical protein
MVIEKKGTLLASKVVGRVSERAIKLARTSA